MGGQVSYKETVTPYELHPSNLGCGYLARNFSNMKEGESQKLYKV